jgi:hypothetical protein
MNRKEQTLKSIFLVNFVQLYLTDLDAVTTANSVVKHFHESAKSQGMSTAIKFHKEVERHMKMVFLSQKSEFNHFIWTKTDKSGVPRFVKFRKSRVEQPEYARAMLTALAYYRLFTKPVDSDISNITTPGPVIAEHILQEIEEYAKEFFKERKVRTFEPEESPFPAYATTKAGANGPSAMGLTSLKDILALERDGLLTKIIDFSSKVYSNNGLLLDMIERTLAIAKSLPGLILESLKTGRLHLLAEGGGKTRVICIPDIWTQSVLKPIHKYLMNHVLKRMPCDGSFGHEVLGNKVKKFTKHRGLFCFDLAAATDRFPLEIQKAVLKPLLGDLVHEWSQLMVNRPFTFRGKQVYYAVGQPMGLLTSWAAFSVTHHTIINWLKKDKSFYAIIGDDVGISSVEGAKKYQAFMASIGVSINDLKSLIPTDDKKVAEIAKRVFLAGNEISPIPPRVLVESTKGTEGLLEFLQVLANRTGKFRELSGLEKKGVNRLIHKNRDINTDLFQVTLTCPLIKYNPFGPYLDLVAPDKIGVTSRWNSSFPVQTYQNELESYLIEIAVNAINQNPLTLESLGMGNAPRTSDNQSSPLITSYLDVRREGLKRLLRETQAHQGTDDWDDDHVSSPESIFEEIVAGPDPTAPKDFMEKRRVRRKQTIDLLNKYYSRSRFARVPNKKPK